MHRQSGQVECLALVAGAAAGGFVCFGCQRVQSRRRAGEQFTRGFFGFGQRKFSVNVLLPCEVNQFRVRTAARSVANEASGGQERNKINGQWKGVSPEYLQPMVSRKQKGATRSRWRGFFIPGQ